MGASSTTWPAWSSDPMPDPDAALTAAVIADPDDESRWLALAAWFRDNGEDDTAASLRMFWPAVRDAVAGGRSLDSCLEFVRRNAWRLGPRARDFEERGLRSAGD